MSAFERSMLNLTRAGVIIAIVTGVIFLGQLYEMYEGGTATDKLVDYSKKQAEAAGQMAAAAEKFSNTSETAVTEFKKAAADSIKAANAGVRTTQASVKNAQAAFREDQRAWVGIGEFGLVEFDESKLKVQIGFSNSGKTPALNVRKASRFRLYSYVAEGPEPADLTRFEFTPGSAIPPQGKYILHVGDDEKKTVLAHYASIKNGASFLFEFGEIQYNDISGRSHTTRYCVYLADSNAKQLAFCQRFNEMD
jgi:hypothetical protein